MTARLFFKMLGAALLWFAIAVTCYGIADIIAGGDATGGVGILAGIITAWTIIGMWRRRPNRKPQPDPNPGNSTSSTPPPNGADPNAWLYGAALTNPPPASETDPNGTPNFDARMSAALAASENGRAGDALRNLAGAGPAFLRDAAHNIRHWEDNPELKAKKEALIAKHEGKRRERQEVAE